MSALAAEAVDLDHLNRYTGGDRSLNVEVLHLFQTQCGAMLGDLEAAAAAADSKIWRQLTHTLKGAARGIGATGLADASAEAEKADIGDRVAVARTLLRLSERAGEVARFIADFCA